MTTIYRRVQAAALDPHIKGENEMIYKKPGEEFWHEGVCYKVGGRIVANEASDYAGLFGNILEIRTEDDR